MTGPRKGPKRRSWRTRPERRCSPRCAPCHRSSARRSSCAMPPVSRPARSAPSSAEPRGPPRSCSPAPWPRSGRRTVTMSDRRGDGCAAASSIEADLTGMFAVPIPSPVLEGLDERIRRVLEAWTPPPSQPFRHRPGRRASVIAVLAAALAIGGANGSLRALYGFLTGPFDLPWHRGIELNLSQTVDGYRVTLDRAYADATRLGLAILVVDERRR